MMSLFEVGAGESSSVECCHVIVANQDSGFQHL
jgi:hypothetical protein